jgi:hypothetical protein
VVVRLGVGLGLTDRVGEADAVADRVGEADGVADRVGEADGVADRVGLADGEPVPVSKPKKWMASAASTGRLWLTPAMLVASTSTAPLLLVYRVRVNPDCGLSVELGV